MKEQQHTGIYVDTWGMMMAAKAAEDAAWDARWAPLLKIGKLVYSFYSNVARITFAALVTIYIIQKLSYG